MLSYTYTEHKRALDQHKRALDQHKRALDKHKRALDRVLNPKYREKLRRVLNDIGATIDDLNNMTTKRINQIYRTAHRRWHSSYTYRVKRYPHEQRRLQRKEYYNRAAAA